ncbi:MAG: DUF4097 family beta strand repeat-containing protein [Acidobacteriota bacterium]|nr:DUF4097 family beta strand repeat-containing protein [Acidobacteriota bacterium]
MRQRCVMSLALAVSAVVLSSCIIVEVAEPEGGGGRSGEPFRQTVPLTPGGTVAVENPHGNIEIRGWEREEVEIVAWWRDWRRARTGARGPGSARPGPDIRVDAGGDSVKIAPRSGPGDAESPGIDFSLRVPRSVDIRDVAGGEGEVRISDLFGQVVLDAKEGDVTVENFSGSLDLSALNGDVRAEILDLRGEDVIKINVKEGDITLGLQEGARLRIEAEAPDGEISSELDLGARLPSGRLNARTAEDGALVSLRALGGDIRILKVE